jgi:predicted extracellular nuclease
MRTANRIFSICLIFIFIFGMFSFPQKNAQASVAPIVVISQVYGGGGGSTGIYIYDYVELFNAGTTDADISGWSIQYGSAAGNFGSSATNFYVIPAATTITAGKYLLVQLGAAGSAGIAFPVTADLASPTTGPNLSGTSGKVALANISTSLGCGATLTLCTLPDSRIVDLVAYGVATNGEGGTTVNTSALTSQQGAVRKSAGCTDTNNNFNDFDVVTGGANLIPRNSATAAHSCVVADTTPPVVFSTTPLPDDINVPVNWNIDVVFDEAVNVSTSSFSISCDVSGAHTFALSGSGPSYTLNPDSDFTNSETCTATVVAANTADLASNYLAADYIWNFTIAAPPGALSGAGAADPTTLGVGESSLLTVTVTPGTGPDSTGINVVCDLSSINGSATQALYDDATNGDVTATDNIFSYDATVGFGTVAGAKSFSCTVADDQARSDDPSIDLTVAAPTNPSGVGLATPSSVMQGNDTLLTMAVTGGQYPASTGLDVMCNVDDIGIFTLQRLYDDGTHGDATASDNIFSLNVTVRADTTVGVKSLSCTISDAQSRSSIAPISVTVTLQVCGTTHTNVFEVQGSGDVSPLNNTTVTVEGVVTGDLTGSSRFGGFYIQDPDGDANPATSDGVFVYSSTYPVTVGDVVRVAGKVTEYQTVTEIGTVTSVTDCGVSSATIDPLALTLPLPVSTTFEPYEGMLVSFTEPFIVAQNYFLGRYGQMHLSTRRFFTPTNGQGDTVAEFLRSSIVLDDGKTVQNPSPTPYIGTDNTVRAGDTVLAGLTGWVDQGAISSTSGIYGYRLQPVPASVTITRTNPRPAAPVIAGSTLRVVGFNVENYFVTIDAGNSGTYPGGSGYVSGNTPRGADSSTEFTRQRTKLFAGLVQLNADVFGVTELEAWVGAAAPEDFVAGLNAAPGVSGTYAWIGDPATGYGSDVIKNGIFYRTESVTPVGPAMSSIDPIYKRTPIAQTFIDANGHKFSVIVNHFKSKSSCPASTDPDYDTGQGCWNLTRVAEANALLTFIEDVKTASGDPDVLVIGDLNSYGAEDPINTLTSGGLTNEMALFDANFRYSYIFDGYSGYLDHALSTESLHDQIVGVKPWPINSDEPSIIDYNTEYKATGSYPPDLYAPDAYRASDHDPIVIGLDLESPTVPVSPDGTLTSWDQSFHWTDASDPSYFLLEVYDADLNSWVRSKWINAGTACVSGDCQTVMPSLAFLPNGNYKWRIRNWSPGGYGEMSEFMNFTLDVPCYTLSTTISNGTIDVKTSQNCTGGYTTGTSVKLKVVPNVGYAFYNWTGDASGKANPLFITMDANKSVTANLKPITVLISPSGSASPWINTFRWNERTGATMYLLQVYNDAGTTLIGKAWVPASGNCVAGICQFSPSALISLPNGNYKWRVQDFGAYGTGMATLWMKFTLP